MATIEGTLINGLEAFDAGRSSYLCNSILFHYDNRPDDAEAAIKFLTEYFDMHPSGQHFDVDPMGRIVGPAAARHARRIFIVAAIHLANKLGV